MITDDELAKAAWTIQMYVEQRKASRSELRSDKQRELIEKLAKQKDAQLPSNIDTMTKGEASQWIDAHIKKA